MRGRVRYALLLLILPLLPFTLKMAMEDRPIFNSPATKDRPEQVAEIRTQLLIGLDLLVRAELGMHHEASEFSRALGRVPELLGGLTYFYRIEITQATRDRLVVMATADVHRANPLTAEIAGDRVAIDDRFHVRANFPMPLPAKEYLRTMAQTVLNRIEQSDFVIPHRADLDLLEGVFHGYFRYEIRPTSSGGRAAVAVGVTAPVKDETIEAQKGADLFEWAYNHRHTDWIDREAFGQLEKIHMAQSIHQHHIGEYSTDLHSLQAIWGSIEGGKKIESPVSVDDLTSDPTLLYRAELNARTSTETPKREPASKSRTWVLNGYGQISELSPIETVVQKFEDTRRRVLSHGEGPGKPLIIDAVDGEK